jgi:hypothetical protein
MNDLEKRLRALERANARGRLALGLMGAALGGVVLLGLAGQPQPTDPPPLVHPGMPDTIELIRAKRIEIVDNDGFVFAELSSYGSFGENGVIRTFDGRGHVLFEVNATADRIGTIATLRTKARKNVVLIDADEDRKGRIRTFGIDDEMDVIPPYIPGNSK